MKMIARCTANTRDALASQELRDAYDRNVHQEQVELVVGQLYKVFGIVSRGGVPWYLVTLDDDDDYPVPHLVALFELVDGEVPKGWSLALDTGVGDYAILPTRWAADPHYMERLVDGDPREVAYFRGMK